MKKIKHFILIISTLMLAIIHLNAVADSLAPDRSQQLLDILAVECQNISDYALMAQYGDTSRFQSVKEHLSVSINNISMLMNGYDNASINALWSLFNRFSSDAQSAQNAVNDCMSIRGDIYRRISNDPALHKNEPVNSYEDCVNAGYHVNGGTCFIGGVSVYDDDGNLIGFYYSDCYDSAGYHAGTCWDCFYGADNEGCIRKR